MVLILDFQKLTALRTVKKSNSCWWEATGLEYALIEAQVGSDSPATKNHWRDLNSRQRVLKERTTPEQLVQAKNTRTLCPHGHYGAEEWLSMCFSSFRNWTQETGGSFMWIFQCVLSRIGILTICTCWWIDHEGSRVKTWASGEMFRFSLRTAVVVVRPVGVNLPLLLCSNMVLTSHLCVTMWEDTCSKVSEKPDASVLFFIIPAIELRS